MKVTKWFDGVEKPIHVGVYQRKYSSGMIHPCLWNGKEWMFAGETYENAAKETIRSMATSIPWRGLANKPKVK